MKMPKGLWKKGLVFAVIVLFVGVSIVSVDSVYGFGDPLTVSAPDSVNVGEEITITVTSDGDPVQGADVYINGINNIGSTNSNGEIEYVFDFIGIYIVSAYKFGYDLSNTVSVTVEQPLLTISIVPLAPTTNDEVTITVKENLVGEPVSGVNVKIDGSSIGTTDSNGEIEYIFNEAKIYSITAEKEGYTDAVPHPVTVTDFFPLLVVIPISPISPRVGDEVTFSVTAVGSSEIEGATVKIDGVSKGTTNANGKFQYTFDEGGMYSITAEKDGYTGSLAYHLNIIEIESWLTIDPLIPSKVGEEIIITVRENVIGDPVTGASVSIKKNLTGDNYDFIDTTDSSGTISYTFDESGCYLIKAEKDGYISGETSIIVNVQFLFCTVSPLLVEIGYAAIISVESDSQPVQGATVYIKENTTDLYYTELDVTDVNGEVQYIPNEEGIYSIKVEKNGFSLPCYCSLTVTPDLSFSVSLIGAVFPLPDSLEDKLKRNSEIQDLLQLPYVSLIVNGSGLFTVFSNEKIDTGLASVEGTKIVSLTWSGLEVSVVHATEISVETTGSLCTVNDIESNPGNYAYKVVRLEENIVQCPFMFDFTGLNIPINIGRIDSPLSGLDFSSFIDSIYNFNQNFSLNIYKDIINFKNQGLTVFNFDKTGFWLDSKVSIDAIVMYPDIVRDFTEIISNNEIGNVVIPSDESVVLFILNAECEAEETTISEVNSNPSYYANKVVSFEGSYLGVSVSVKQMISHVSAEIGQLLPVDLTLHGNIVWTVPPPTNIKDIESKSIVAIGASSISQTNMVETKNGVFSVYQFTGKILSANQIDSSLNSVSLIIYDIEKVRDISSDEITDNIKNTFQEMVANITYLLKRETPYITDIPSNNEGEPVTIKIDIENLENIILNLNKEINDGSITTINLKSRPSEVTINATGEVYGYFEIKLHNISNEDIEDGTIEFKVEKTWLTDSNIDKNNVILQRYVDGNWEDLLTVIDHDTYTHVYYNAETSGFSYFAISGGIADSSYSSSNNGDNGENQSTPGFEFVIAVIAFLLYCGFLVFRKR